MEVKLVVTKGSKKPQVIHLRSDETVVGRQQGCDLRIPSPEVSRRHCRLSMRDDCLLVEDLASVNGSYLNGVRIEGQELVRPGDVLTIGPVVFRVEYHLSSAAIRRMLGENTGGVAANTPTPLPPAAAFEIVEMTQAAAEEPAESIYTVAELDEQGVTSGDANTTPINADDLGWRAPTNEDVRDILSQLGDDA
jgi:pSer/pThr/pTyr-binding forkhead associated (FHA) protein